MKQGKIDGNARNAGWAKLTGLLSLLSALATKSEFSSSAITIDIHLLDPGVDRSIAELEECRLGDLYEKHLREKAGR